jgi:uncharacterized membrane protein HdeD (DUF308 family)
MLDVLAKNRTWLFVRGIAAILFGVLAFIWPGITLLVLVLLYGAYALVDGVAALVLALRGRRPKDTPLWTIVLVGIAGIAAGIITFLWPGITALALLVVVAAWAIVRGIFEIVAAVRLRKEIDGEWLLGLAGALSIVFGVLLLLQPAAGLLALVWLVGIYSIIAGILYISLGVRLGHPERRAPHAPRPA